MKNLHGLSSRTFKKKGGQNIEDQYLSQGHRIDERTSHISSGFYRNEQVFFLESEIIWRSRFQKELGIGIGWTIEVVCRPSWSITEYIHESIEVALRKLSEELLIKTKQTYSSGTVGAFRKNDWSWSFRDDGITWKGNRHSTTALRSTQVQDRVNCLSGIVLYIFYRWKELSMPVKKKKSLGIIRIHNAVFYAYHGVLTDDRISAVSSMWMSIYIATLHEEQRAIIFRIQSNYERVYDCIRSLVLDKKHLLLESLAKFHRERDPKKFF